MRHRDHGTAAADHFPLVGKVDIRDMQLFATDIFPDVHLGPVADREHANVFARMHARVVGVPQLRALVLGIPLAELVAEREDALLGARLLLVAPGSPHASVEAELGDGLQQRHRLVRIARLVRVLDDDGAAPDRIFQRTHDEPLAQVGREFVAARDHFGEVVLGVDVHQRKGELCRPERLFRQTQHHDGILAAGEQQRRIPAFCRDLAHDVDGFALQRIQMGEGVFVHDVFNQFHDLSRSAELRRCLLLRTGLRGDLDDALTAGLQ